MKVSVVIPVYNRADLIIDALNSLKRQRFTDFEVIIIDDGSNDNVKDIISLYQHDLKLKYLYKSHTGNIAYLRNQGTFLAEGEYIAVLDSDDWCQDDRLELQYEYMINNKECDILASWVYIVDDVHDENTKRLEQLYNKKYCRDEIIKYCLNDGSCICHSTVMMKKDLLTKLNGYDERMYICEDFNLWLRAILANARIEIIPKKLVYRRIHRNSVTAGYNGADDSVRLVINNKLQYLYRVGKLNNKIIIWGKNSRDKILIKELSKFNINVNDILIIDIYQQNNYFVDNTAFHLVTTYSHKKEVFKYFDNNGLSIVDDYIYI